MIEVNSTTLKGFQALKDVPEVQLNWLIAQSEHYLMEDGEMLAAPDVPFLGTHFIISGSCTAYTLQSGNQREIGIIGSGEITGYLPYSRARSSAVFISAIDNIQVMMLPYDKAREMITLHFELTQSLVHVMSNRIKYVTALQSQNEKMMALGKLSAGMTHELNNPASANIRDASYLLKSLRNVPSKVASFLAMELLPSEYGAALAFLKEALTEGEKKAPVLKERRQLEDTILTWLEDESIENADDLAETFADFNIGVKEIQSLQGQIKSEQFSRLLNWMLNSFELIRTAENIQESSRRISSLVNSVKTYTHMDRGADKQKTDIHTGIKNTLTMLEHKIRAGNIRIEENFDDTIPEFKALVGELNQVWTNLIDNALDAMSESHTGTLKITTEQEKGFVKVAIIDDGPGIPEEIMPLVFDPFFTTKKIGQGTGIGLELVKGIVNQHNGSIKAKSTPGRTEFIVCLPLNS